ncbi:MAG: SDR family NAD(P)-dependent oxidoreductase, partial [Rhodobacteraceae bacterium]|nr:SDR family NAD(P)-dependent oxidoreductase [Paracoccaceae bacterium]
FEPRFPFTLFAVPEADGLRLSYDFDTALFSDYDVAQVANRMEAALDQLFAMPEQLTLLEALENAPETAVVAVFGQTRLTYGELRAQSDSVARILAAKGLGAGDLVGIMMPRSDKMLVALLGVLKSGAAYVPLDPESPNARISALIKSAGIGLVLGDASAGLPVPNLPVAEWAQQKQTHVQESLLGRAYVMFTSGSTGAPKGVEISHANLNTYLRHAQGYFEGQALGAVASSPFTFDATITAMLAPIMAAKTVYILPQDQQEIPELANIMQAERPFVFKITPAHIAALFGYLEGGSRAPHRFIIGGEALKTNVLQRFATHFPNAVFVNEYGPTEATVGCCVAVYTAAEVSRLQGATVPIGHPIEGVELSLAPETGELVIKGAGVAVGYLGQPALTAEHFRDGGYHTGDLATRLPGGRLRYDGRMDDQINLNGYRIEPAEIEAALESAQGVESAIVTTQNGPLGEAQLVAHCKGAGLSGTIIRDHITALLPAYMVPQHIEILADIPLTPNGKTDKANLAPATGPQAQILAAFEAVLGYPVLPDQHFFEAGAGSLVLMKVHANLCRETGADLHLVDFFQHPTAQQLAAYLADEMPAEPVQAPMAETDDGIAIVGMAANVATAPTLADFARLVFGSTSGLTSPEAPEPGRVAMASILDNPFGFDPDYFGISHKEARLMDPQQRHLLMGAVQALENAGMRPDQGRIGCLMSSSENTYHLQQVNASDDFQADRAPLAMQNEKDFLASRIAYHLGLTGPAFTVQSACSSSLLGVHQACNMLQQGEAESVVVGGVAIDQMTFGGYPYREGGILSKSGACTPFSDSADGTVPGNGYGVVVLKPLAKARADGNRIYAVIKGSATNNDGKNKVGFTAPSVAGQAGAIRAALTKAGLGPKDISYLEAHGTATNLGDPIEVQALKKVFDKEARVALSSLKSQIGHLGAGAGVAGLIRAALAVYLGEIPPNHGFSRPNPALALEDSPFYIPTAASPWPAGPRHAGVSSFGLGGTNVHVVLSHEPSGKTAPSTRPACLALSAPTEAALKAQIAKMSTYLAMFSGDFQALAQHLQTGQRPQPWRVAVMASTPSEALILLQATRPQLTARSATALTLPASAPEIAQAFLAGQDILGTPSPMAPWDTPPRPFQLASFNVEAKNKRPAFEDWFSQPGWARMGRAVVNGFQPDIVWEGQEIAPTGPALHIWLRVGALPLADALAELGALMSALGPRSAHVVVMTAQACAVGATPASRPEHAALGAALRVLALEHPALQFTHLDLTDEFDPTGLHTPNLPTGASLALRAGMLWQARLDPAAMQPPAFTLQKGGVYVVTGGTGGIGQHLENMINSAGATALIVARSAPDPQLSCDIADPHQMAKLAGYIANTHGRIFGVFHAAGAVGGGVLHHLSAQQIKQNIRAKLEGFKQVSTHLAPLTDGFILSLSSMSALMGVRGQADYAAANAAVDALSLASHNGPAVMSVNLPTWRETGMAAGQDLSGFEGYALSPKEGVRAIEHVLALGLPQVAVSPLPMAQVAAMMVPESHKDETVRAIFCAALGLENCDDDASFNDLGGDSLASLDVLDGLNASFGLAWRAADLGADFSIRSLEARLKAPAVSMAPADLVLVHPIGGDIGCYRALQSALGGLNLGLIEDPFIAGAATKTMSVEESAAAYIAQLPQGDFWLGGWSFGAVVAFEMVRQLEQAGRAPLGLVMIDPPAPMRTAMPDKQALEQTFRAEIIAQTGHNLGQDHPHFRRIVEACTRNTQALARYQPTGHVACPTQLFLAGARGAVEQSWQAFAPAKITRLKADHYSILRPPALHVLAQHLLGLAQPEKENAHV